MTAQHATPQTASTAQTFADLYDVIGQRDAVDPSVLDESLGPRSKELLFDLVGDRLPTGRRALDVGCGSGRHTATLAQRFGAEAAGIDVNLHRLARCRADLAARVPLTGGDITHLPFAGRSFALVWSCDMLPHIADLDGAMAECRRVLEPGGSLIVYTTVVTSRLTAAEMDELHGPARVVPESMRCERVLDAVTGAGFDVEYVEHLGGELVEHAEESDGRHARNLLRLARLQRAPDRFRALLGPERCETLVALYSWEVFHLLGKLSALVCAARRPVR